MSIRYLTVEEAIAAPGLRLVVVGGVPSPWSEAAKGIFHIKRIAFSAVRLTYDSPALKAWTGQRSAPVAMYEQEPPRCGWVEILELAERLAPQPRLMPLDADDRADAFALAQALCGEHGLGWSRRLQLIDAGLAGRGGFPPDAARYLGRKYGYAEGSGAAATARVVQLLTMLSSRLKAQHAAGSRYYVGHELTAVDIYSAAFMALLRPLPEDVCAMEPSTRSAFSLREPLTDAALDEVLLAHRAMMYREHLELPLSL